MPVTTWGKISLLILVTLLTSCQFSSAPSATLTPLTIQLSWAHGAQFAGLYAAEQYGYYADEGLSVTLLQASPSTDRVGAVLSGNARLGFVGPPPLVLARAAGKPVRAIAAIHRHSPFVFFALAESNITRPQQFAGKTIQVASGALPILHAVAGRVGLSPGHYHEDTRAGLADLYTGAVDVASGFLTNEVLQARADGHSLSIIYPDDYGVHFYGDVLFSSDQFIAQHPDVVQRFLRATLKGWADVLREPDSAGALVQVYVPEADPQWENSSMSASVPLIFTSEEPIGWMEPATWEQITATLRAQKVLDTNLDPYSLYTMQFLENHYGGHP